MKKPEKREHLVLIDGKEADDKLYKRIVNAPAPPADAKDLRQRPLSNPRPFQLMR